MSMSTHVVGFKPPDDKWKKMKAVWDACQEAQASLPEEVVDFFDGSDPDPAGVEVKIKAREWSDDSSEGYEIDVDAIPKGVKVIRFYNSF